MQKIYLDNAATTPLAPEVIDDMMQVMQEDFGNPSSTHQFGRKAKSRVELVRKSIAQYFSCQPGQVVFTSGGSEADNLVLFNAITHWGIDRVISAKIEHHAVLHTLEELAAQKNFALDFVALDDRGTIDLDDLETLLKKPGKKLVSLMLVNNEIGNLLPVDRVSELCRTHEAMFHSDSVQAIGHVEIDLKKSPIDFLAASAHKFHGPKGVGFAIVPKDLSIEPLIRGGAQEMGLRAGTENTHSIVGMGKAFEMAISKLAEERAHLIALKSHFIAALKREFEGLSFNGLSDDLTQSAPHILNVRFDKELPMLLFQLDLKGIAVSGGSACQSGSQGGSHVLAALNRSTGTSVRFSFSKYNTFAELDQVIGSLKELI